MPRNEEKGCIDWIQQFFQESLVSGSNLISGRLKPGSKEEKEAERLQERIASKVKKTKKLFRRREELRRAHEGVGDIIYANLVEILAYEIRIGELLDSKSRRA